MNKVAVLYGGCSSEREVSLSSGQAVYQALQRSAYDVELFDTATRPLSELTQYDRVFIALHGRYGEDGTIQGLLELLHIPYTGCGVMASSIAMDKIMTKRIWESVQLPTPAYYEVRSLEDLHHAVEVLGLPLILKAPHEGSTLGLQRIDTSSDVDAIYQQLMVYDEVLLAEQFISGRELTVPVLGRGKQAKALPIVEIKAPNGQYDYKNKYISNDTRYECPAQLPEELTAYLQHLSEQAYRVLGCEGWARVDILLDQDNRPYLLEINTSPGMTSHSLVPMSAAVAGYSFEALCKKLLDEASCKIQQVTSV